MVHLNISDTVTLVARAPLTGGTKECTGAYGSVWRCMGVYGGIWSMKKAYWSGINGT